MGLHDIPLLDRDTILRRLKHMKGAPNLRRMDQITWLDLARHVGVKVELIKGQFKGRDPITETWQIIYSRFFHMVDTGQLVLRHEGEGRFKKKILVAVPKPAQPPKKPVRPYVDLSDLRIKFV